MNLRKQVMKSDLRSAKVELRPAVPEDAEVCGRVFYEAFVGINKQHGFEPELPSLEWATGVLKTAFSHPGFHCQVAEFEKRVVGSACQDERSPIVGIGPISVAPDTQNRGIGRCLTRSMIDRVTERKLPGVRLLQSTFHNRSLSLYAKLGFGVREPLAVMAGLPLKQRANKECAVRSAKNEDLEAANKLCRRVHGYARSLELSEAIEENLAFVVEREGRMTGYAAGFGYFGHAVAELNLDLKALLCVAEKMEGPGIVVPTRNAELFYWCLESGMRVVQPMTLMTIGLYNEPAGAYLPSVTH
jgi:GNAT superfamily N-acetyltransferase